MPDSHPPLWVAPILSSKRPGLPRIRSYLCGLTAQCLLHKSRSPIRVSFSALRSPADLPREASEYVEPVVLEYSAVLHLIEWVTCCIISNMSLGQRRRCQRTPLKRHFANNCSDRFHCGVAVVFRSYATALGLYIRRESVNHALRRDEHDPE